jgi:hypothetical protein
MKVSDKQAGPCLLFFLIKKVTKKIKAVGKKPTIGYAD